MEKSVCVFQSYVKVKRTDHRSYLVYYGCCQEILHVLQLLEDHNSLPEQNYKLRRCCSHITEADRSWISKILRLKTYHHITAELIAWLSTLGSWLNCWDWPLGLGGTLKI